MSVNRKEVDASSVCTFCKVNLKWQLHLPITCKFPTGWLFTVPYFPIFVKMLGSSFQSAAHKSDPESVNPTWRRTLAQPPRR